MKKVMFFLFFGIGLFLNFTSCKDNDLCEVDHDPLLSCLCFDLYDPVCGCDGKTYGNDCEADCAGVPSYEPGPCN